MGKLLTFDLECIPASPAGGSGADKKYRDLAKSSTSAQIVAIAASAWDPDDWENMDLFVGYEGTNERRLLREFDIFRQKHLPEDGRSVWVGHNILGYDCPTLMMRSLLMGLDALARDVTPSSRWGDSHHLDTMRLLGPSQRFVSLGALCNGLGIPHPSTDGGGKVYDWWLDGNHVAIRQHVMDDLKALNALVLRLHQAGIFTPQEAPHAR